MGTYAIYDFTETVNHVDSPINERQVDKVLYAYGESYEGYGQWSGGFILLMKDGHVNMVTGWCDTSGWGCQDGMSIYSGGTPAELVERANKASDWVPTLDKWDILPEDLNRYLRGEKGTWD